MRLLGLIAGVTFVIDQLSKYLVVFAMDLQSRQAIDVFPPFLNFRMGWNRGINFGLFSSHEQALRWGLVVLALAISVGVVLWIRKETASARAHIAAGLLVGGALGNAIDRVLYGAVADFLNMTCCGFHNPSVFNLADVAIFAGALGLVVFTSSRKTP